MATFPSQKAPNLEDYSKRRIAIYARVSTEEQGRWKGGAPHYGYDYNRKTENPEVNRKEAKVVRMIFSHYLRRKGIRLVTNYLNRRRISTRSGGRWIDNTVGVILSRETYNGVLRTGDVII